MATCRPARTDEMFKETWVAFKKATEPPGDVFM